MTEEKQVYELAVSSGLPVPMVSIQVWAERRKQFNEWVNSQLREDVDFGVVPGASKPSLLKPGAEKILQLYGCLLNLVITGEDCDPSTGYYNVNCRAEALTIQGGQLIGVGVGRCCSFESKYRWRWDYWRKSSPPPDVEGWETFWDKKANTEKYRRRLENRDLIDQWNTVLKMAKKRAAVDLALTISGASEKFTQDVEDFAEDDGKGKHPAATASPARISQAINATTRLTQDLISKKGAAPTPPSAESPVPTSSEPSAQPSAATAGNGKRPAKVDTKASTTPDRPWSAEYIREMLGKVIEKRYAGNIGEPNPKQLGLVVGLLGQDQERHVLLDYMFGIKSSRELKHCHVCALLDWLKPVRDGDSGPYRVDFTTEVERTSIVEQALRDAGQLPLLEELPGEEAWGTPGDPDVAKM